MIAVPFGMLLEPESTKVVSRLTGWISVRKNKLALSVLESIRGPDRFIEKCDEPLLETFGTIPSDDEGWISNV